MQALYLLALEPVAETTADRHSYGFRAERSPADAIEQCFAVLANRERATWVLEGDITSCFDRISHTWLLAHVPMDRSILRKWLKAGYMERHILYPTTSGTPQGGIISPVLANLTLDGLEQALREAFPKAKNGQSALVNPIRFADDFIITGRSKALLEDEVKPLVEQFMRERGLELSTAKTSITHIEDGFDFLGQNVRKYNGKLLIKPSKKNRKTFLEKVRKVVKANPTMAAGKLVRWLNPLIRGWAYYHRHVVSKRVFGSVDNMLYQLLWQWAKRRHPRKRRWWIAEKYFFPTGSKRWVFHGEVDGQDYLLFQATSVRIKRHVKVKAEANPFDPHWEPYFERRLAVKIEATLKGRRQLLRLWKEQDGICPVCEQKITELTGWHNHHIVWRVMGGPDRDENRVLLHPNCHQQVHSQGLYVEKPRPARGEREA